MYRALVDQLPAIAYLVRIDPVGRTGFSSPTIFISSQVQEVLGFTREEWLADPALWMKQLHPDDKDRVIKAVELSNQHKTNFQLEYRAARKDGRYINIANSARHLLGTDGLYYTEGLMFDITPQKRQALRDSVLAYCAERVKHELDLPTAGMWMRNELNEVVAASNLLVAIKDRHSGWVSFPVYYDEVDSPPSPRPPAHSLVDYILEHNRSFHWQRPGDRDELQEAGYAALGAPSNDWIGVPIPGSDQPMGVLALQIYDAGRYMDEDIALLESIASALGHVLLELQRAEDTRRRLAHDELLASISTQALSATDLNAFLSASIEEMGRRLRVSRSYLFEHHEEDGWMTNTIEWCASGITAQKESLQKLPIDQFRWHVDQLKRGEAVCFQNVQDIPDPATRDELIRQHIVSQMAVPMFVDGEYYGFIGFDECGDPRAWPQEELPILTSIANILNHVIERERLKEKQAEQIKELQRWHDITLGRENRVLELKQEVNDLLLRLDESPRYSET